MRHTLAGLALCLLLLCVPSTVLAQIRGEVESIGFGGNYRPDCWTPVVIRLNTEGLKTQFYQLQVTQEDLDRDRAVYTQPISVDTSQSQQRFWMFFKPTPRGLSDPTGATTSLDALRKVLRVEIANLPGNPSQAGRPIGQFALTQTPTSLDGPDNPSNISRARGRKLILVIHDGSAQPAFREYDTSVGTMEDVSFVLMQPRDLPENPIAYDAVDAILWLNGDANLLDEGGARRLAAIEAFVRQGGRLVVCQPAERARLTPLAPMLPVEYIDPGAPGIYKVETRELNKLLPLRLIARSDESPARDRVWDAIKGPFQMAMATPRPNALTEDRLTIDWPDGKTSPWLVRGVVGMGGVTWVAQDLGNPALTARTTMAGWVHVWDTVFGWNNDTETNVRDSLDADKLGYPLNARGVDLGATLLGGMEHQGRGAALVLLAVVFFILYWIAAGPGSYFALSTYGKKELSWIAFAAAAVVAGLLTLVVVRLVLRGAPVVKHTTVVRSALNQPAIASSNIGLYIPNDGAIPVTLDKVAPGSLSYVAAYAEHPQRRPSDTELPPVQGQYAVPVPGGSEATAPVEFPYRSTLKKVEARWAGDLPGRIDGKTSLASDNLRGVDGRLTNNTGVDLVEIHIAYRNERAETRIFYVEKWLKGTTIDFARDVLPPILSVRQSSQDSSRLFAEPHDGRPGGMPIIDVVGTGTASRGWTTWWYRNYRGGGSFGLSPVDDSRDGYNRTLPMLALFDALPPARRPNDQTDGCFQMLRRGARYMNLSQVVTNGQMLVTAVAAGRQPLPYPFLVDGDAYGGEGDVLYEFVVPLDRTPPVDPTTTAPASTVPATKPVETKPVEK